MVTLKGSYTVKPAGETPTGLMYLPEIDQFTSVTHTSALYFYRPAAELTPNALENLKISLSKALAIFYPLAGLLQPTSRGRYEINCNSMGALFVEAEIDAKMEGYEEWCLTPEAGALVPPVDYNRPVQEMPLCFAQLTKFSCGGVSLGVGISHAIVDGQSLGHFISEWARIARGEQPEQLPFLDRTVLQPDDVSERPMFDHPEYSPPPLLIGQSSDEEERNKKTDVAIVKLSRDQVQKLISRANEYPIHGRPFTRFEAVAAHVWRCVCKARHHKIKQLTRVRIAVDIRSRVEPPLPAGYFGNAILPVVPATTSGEIVLKPLGYTSEKLREVIDKMTNKYIRSSFLFLKNEPDLSHIRYINIGNSTQKKAFYGNPNLSITNLSRMPFYGVDFGWGKEINMVPGRVGEDEKVYIFPGRDEDGSLVFPLRLQTTHMNAFKKLFYEDIYNDSILLLSRKVPIIFPTSLYKLSYRVCVEFL